MVKKFTIPFASQGDANDIPNALQVDGRVSFTQGFGYDYERPYDDPQAKDIAREDMNGLFKAITSAIGEVQQLGASRWSNELSYPKGAIVYHEKDLFISQIDDNKNKPPQSWTSIKNIADDSLKKNMNLADLDNIISARKNLGLGSSATLNKTDVEGKSNSLVATQLLVDNVKTNLNNGITTAQNTANTAKTDASKAQSAANTAQSKANSAYDLASNALPRTSVVNVLGNSATDAASQALVNSVSKQITDHGIGYNQKWQDVKDVRALDATYKNNTDNPIFIFISVLSTAGGVSTVKIEASIDNIQLILHGGGGGIVGAHKASGISLVIPSKSEYRINSTGQIETWAELR